MKLIAYYRVSTARQGRSGLGLDAQRKAVEDYINGNGWELVGEYTEVESGRRNQRPQLAAALEHCQREKARLVIAKLDRLSRNAGFLLSLRDSGVDFVCCDMPTADRFTVGILALVAEREAELTSERTKEALAAAKRRGVKLGSPDPRKAWREAVKSIKAGADERAAEILPVVREIQSAGISSLGKIAEALNRRGIPTARGRRWHAQTVARVIQRAA